MIIHFYSPAVPAVSETQFEAHKTSKENTKIIATKDPLENIVNTMLCALQLWLIEVTWPIVHFRSLHVRHVEVMCCYCPSGDNMPVGTGP